MMQIIATSRTFLRRSVLRISAETHRGCPSEMKLFTVGKVWVADYFDQIWVVDYFDQILIADYFDQILIADYFDQIWVVKFT